MTDPNTRIAAAMEADPEWQKWATVPCEHWVEHSDLATGAVLGEQRKPEDCQHCRGTGRIPRDFAAHWPKLVEWAAQQEWYLAGATFEQSCCYRLGQAVLVFVEGRSTSAEVGENVRDIIAARLKEIDDAD